MAFSGRSLRAVVVFAALALFLAACGGSDDDDTPTTTPGTNTAGGTGSLTPANGNNSTGPDIDVVFTPGALTQLDSFRFEVVIEGAGDLLEGVGDADAGDERITFTGAWIAPDQAQVVFDLGGLTIQQTIIGNQEWTSFAGINQGPLPASGTAKDLVIVADFIDSSDVLNEAAFECSGTEEVNGIRAVRCEVSEEGYEAFIEGFTEESVTVSDATLVIWIAEAGFVVRSELTATGTSVTGEAFSMRMRANVTDINQVRQITP